MTKASRWLKDPALHQKLKKEVAAPKYFSAVRNLHRLKSAVKASSGRGRKVKAWVAHFYPIILDEFNRLKRAGLKMSNAVLCLIAKNVIFDSKDETFHKESVDPQDGKPILEKITYEWIKRFMEKHRIVIRTHCGKLQKSNKVEEDIHKSVAIHLSLLKRSFDSGLLLEEICL